MSKMAAHRSLAPRNTMGFVLLPPSLQEEPPPQESCARDLCGLGLLSPAPKRCPELGIISASLCEMRKPILWAKEPDPSPGPLIYEIPRIFFPPVEEFF